MAQDITFAHWLKSRRKLLDLTQQALAERIHCSAEMIYRIESGRRRPSAQVARLLGEAVNVPAAELDAFVSFARAAQPTRIHGRHIEATPWRDAFVPSSNLPLQLTSLIGREKDLAEAVGRLRQDDIRLLALIGPPGIGKTRLAIQLGTTTLLDFPAGVFFVPLAAIAHADRMVLEIARTLDIALADRHRPDASLSAYLYERRTLLILDNVEQIHDAAPAIHALLAACPLIKIVVTSRSPLRIRGEHHFRVDALALPGRAGDVSVASLGGVAAVRLFVERATAVQPAFELNEANAATVAAICSRLDGLPLAIEIVAAQTAIMQPAEILHHLTGRSLLESLGTVDSDPRHHSLHAAVDWSLRQLDPAEQAFFCRLGIFIDGFTIDAAREVGIPASDLIASLTKFFNMSLLKRDAVSSTGSRFRMLEIIRQFARAQLEHAGELPRLRQNHADYFRRFACENEESVRRDGQVAGLERFEQDHFNLQAALDFYIEAGAWHEGLELAGALIEFWVYHNHVIIGLQYITALLAATEGDPQYLPRRARALNGAAILSYFAGDFAVIGTFAEQALAVSSATGSRRDIAWACISLGMQQGGMGRYDAAVRYFEQGLSAGEGTELPWEIGSLLNGLGEVARSQGQYDRAMAYYSQALERSEGMGNRWLSAHVLDNIGHAAYAQGRYELARDYMRRSMEASLALGDERGVAMCLEKLGGIALARENPERAARILGAAEVLRETRNTPVEGMDAADYRRLVEQLRQCLPAGVLEEHWTSGRNMPLSQVIDDASSD